MSKELKDLLNTILGKQIFIIVGDIIIFNSIINKNNINKIKTYLLNGYGYYLQD